MLILFNLNPALFKKGVKFLHQRVSWYPLAEEGPLQNIHYFFANRHIDVARNAIIE